LHDKRTIKVSFHFHRSVLPGYLAAYTASDNVMTTSTTSVVRCELLPNICYILAYAKDIVK